MAWTKLIDMELDDEGKLDVPMPMPFDRPDYPPGLRICLCDEQLDKLGLDADCEVGDIIDLRAFACVTSVSVTDSEGGGKCRRVELQIQKLSVENENEEVDE